MNRQLLSTLVIIAAFAALGAIIYMRGGTQENNVPSPEKQGKVVVVTTIYPVYDLIRQVGGKDVEVSYLLPVGASPHTYSPTPENVRRAGKAHLMVMFGSNIDDWASKLHQSEGGSAKLIVLSGAPGTEEKHSGEEDHHHGGEDPHYWMDPEKMIEYSVKISDTLAELYPAKKTKFAERRAVFETEIRALIAEYKPRFEALKHKKFIAYHSAYSHLAERFGLEQAGVIESSPGKAPGPETIAKLVEMVKKDNIKAIFAEPQLSARAAEMLSKNAGIPLRKLDPLGNPDDPERDTYIKNMRRNLDAVLEALNG